MYSMLMEKITDLNVKETIISNNPCGRDVCSSYAAISEAPTDQSALQVTHQRLVRFSSQSLWKSGRKTKNKLAVQEPHSYPRAIPEQMDEKLPVKPAVAPSMLLEPP